MSCASAEVILLRYWVGVCGRIGAMLEIPEGLREHASLQEYLHLAGKTVDDLHPKTQQIIECSGEPLTAIPWGVVLIDHRPPTEREIVRGQELSKGLI
jgi:hypothetical protein